jgi:nicotinamide-nucleotide amidase
MTKIQKIHQLAQELGLLLFDKKLCCAVAESCTGGGLSAAITDIAGSSQWFDRGFVTYTNEAKEEMLNVPREVITSHGAVSEATVRAMAQGAIANSNAHLSAAISGIAGPGGGSKEKPVGTVWIAWSSHLQPTIAHCYLFNGDRLLIREQAVQAALEGLIECSRVLTRTR